MESGKEKKCGRKFRFPECLHEPCRYKCVGEFNKGRKIKFVLKGGSAVEDEKKKTEGKKIKKLSGVKRYDRTTMRQLHKVFMGIPVYCIKTKGVWKWRLTGKTIFQVERAKNGKIDLEVPPGFEYGTEKTKRPQVLSIELSTESGIKEFRNAVLKWLRSRP